jgi:hypothetical protein
VEQAALQIQAKAVKSSTKSGADGFFRLGPLREFRVGIGTMEGLQPSGLGGWPERLNINISHPGYAPLQLEVPRDTSTWNSPVKTSTTWNGDLELGKIMLRPTPRH